MEFSGGVYTSLADDTHRALYYTIYTALIAGQFTTSGGAIYTLADADYDQNTLDNLFVSFWKKDYTFNYSQDGLPGSTDWTLTLTSNS